MNMPELMPSAEKGIGDVMVLPFVKGIGDRTIREHLQVFQNEMRTARGSEAFFSLFAPIEGTEVGDVQLLHSADSQPQTLADQVRWAYANPGQVSPEVQNRLNTLQYYAVESLRNNPEHKLHGEIRTLSKETLDTANRAIESYDAYINDIFDPDDPGTANVLDTAGIAAKVGVTVTPLALLVSCGIWPGAKSSEIPVNPLPTTTPISSPAPEGTAMPHKEAVFMPAVIIGGKPIEIGPTDETGSQFQNFANIEEAKAFINGEGEAKWLQGDPKTEIAEFPWKHPETMETFAQLKSIGRDPHFVFLVADASGNKFTFIGLEHFYGNTLLDFIDANGKSTTILVKGNVSIKDLLGDKSDELWVNNIMTWPDMSYPAGNCPQLIDFPTDQSGKQMGVTEGIACTIDRKSGHFFQAQSRGKKK